MKVLKLLLPAIRNLIIIILVSAILAWLLQGCASTNKYQQQNNGCWKGAEPKLRPYNKMRA
jgi:hypothetical protein